MRDARVKRQPKNVEVVDALPALPNERVPVGTVLRLSINDCLYRCEGDRWVRLSEEVK